LGIEFLNDEHLQHYGHFHRELTTGDLEQHCTLTEEDLKRILECRNDHSKLGFAVQLCTLKLLHTFPNDFSNTPQNLIDFIAVQLGIQPDVLARYLERRPTRFEHQREIRAYLGYREFTGVPVITAIRWLFAKLALADERPIALFNGLIAELIGMRVELPSASTLARLIVKTRERIAGREYHQIATRLSAPQARRLEDLLIANPKKHRLTPLGQLREAPTRSSTFGLLQGLERLKQVREVGVGNIKLDDIPESRLLSLARQGEPLWSANFNKFSSVRRRATLLALVQYLERTATDDVLTIFESILAGLNLRGEQRRRQEHLKTLPELNLEALKMREALLPVLDATISNAKLRSAILEKLSLEQLTATLERVATLAHDKDDRMSEVWENAINTLSQFFIAFISDIKFEGTIAANDLLEALRWLKRSAGTAQSTWGEVPRKFIPSSWLPMVFPNGVLKRPSYLICAAQQLFQFLKRREVFVRRSTRYTDPRGQLLQGIAWQDVKADVCRSLGLSEQPKGSLETMSRSLDEAYKRVVRNLPENQLVRMELENGVLTPKITPLKALPESASLKDLARSVEARYPEIPLPELLLEINARNGFVTAMLEQGEVEPVVVDVATSVVAVLVAQACNIGLNAVANEYHPALKLARLQWVKQRYVNADAISSANAKLVEDHQTLELTKAWGGGEVASADGLRFVVAARSIYTAPNKKYFDSRRGVTHYALTSDQYTMLHGVVVTGTLRDSLVILGTVLEQPTNLKPMEIMSDTAGYSDVVFGLFHLLGYQFSPRLADIGKARYWRVSRNADYGALNDVTKNRIDTALIAEHWEDILRLIGSLKLGAVKAPDIMRILTRDGSNSGLGNAIAEFGRMGKTLYLLDYLDDEAYRRRIHTQLNRGESRGRMARALYHGNKGEIHQRYRRGMETQLGALGLVVNIVTLWNTLYCGAALQQLEMMGHDVLEEDVARLSPLKWRHVNVLGTYSFVLSPSVASGDLRPLRDPNVVADVGDDWDDADAA
jgi:TnpA family transposase